MAELKMIRREIEIEGGRTAYVYTFEDTSEPEPVLNEVEES